ncbi:hypothetical protein QWY15_12045 [Planococcus sp. N064]|uniref:DUF2294 domain-containing protein n=1 Tax=Planococcus liqunii TaxID=3058394 RepID=A0ABT8MT02_9BACL|nr:hypothetical protein [Planococcus sp. N064]MDN7228030.1 hypothetical protein [Planococcus sp. N064]
MKKINKNFAERALKKLLIGSQLDGLQFGAGHGTVRICFAHYSEKEPDTLWLNIEVRKIAIIASQDRLKSISTEQLSELSEEDLLPLLLRHRRERVNDVWLGDASPHLYLSFESGRVLFING